MFSFSQCILLLNVNYNNDNFELQINIVKLKEGKPSLCQNKLADSARFWLFECLQWGKSKYGIKCLPIWMLTPHLCSSSKSSHFKHRLCHRSRKTEIQLSD